MSLCLFSTSLQPFLLWLHQRSAHDRFYKTKDKSSLSDQAAPDAALQKPSLLWIWGASPSSGKTGRCRVRRGRGTDDLQAAKVNKLKKHSMKQAYSTDQNRTCIKGQLQIPRPPTFSHHEYHNKQWYTKYNKNLQQLEMGHTVLPTWVYSLRFLLNKNSVCIFNFPWNTITYHIIFTTKGYKSWI